MLSKEERVLKARKIGKIIAGKTGTTNKSNDGWFIGFSPNIAVGVYVGFDNPRSLGRSETAASTALPIWIEFMQDALKDQPNLHFKKPQRYKVSAY